jgi:hypothetical protein
MKAIQGLEYKLSQVQGNAKSIIDATTSALSGSLPLTLSGAALIWVDYVPTFTNLGIVTPILAAFSIMGKTCFINTRFQMGTGLADIATVSMPIGIVIDQTKIGFIAGRTITNDTGAGLVNLNTLVQTKSTFSFANDNGTANPFLALNGSSFTANTIFEMIAEVPFL